MAFNGCSENCVDSLPETNFNDCAPDSVESEIVRIFFALKGAAPFSDWKSPEEWSERVSQTDITDKDKIRVLTVIGDKPAPTSTPRVMSNRRRFTPFKEHTINISIDDVSNENYDFMRALECGAEGIMWYETIGGKMFGGNAGIQKVTLALDDLLPSGEGEYETLGGTATWRAKLHPDRIDSPILGVDFPRVAVGG